MSEQRQINPTILAMCESFRPGPEGQGSHRLYLLRAILQTTGPILELGMGEYSTPALHATTLLAGRRVSSYDNVVRWVHHYAGLRNRLHSIEHVPSYDDVPCQAEAWDVALVDGAPNEERGKILPRLTHVPLVVCHDSESASYGYAQAFTLFRYVKTFKNRPPWTTVVSNTDDVTQWQEI